MAWCRQLPCAIKVLVAWSEHRGPVEFAHIDGNYAAKASNMHGLPLCWWCHRGSPRSEEKRKHRFFEHYGIDREALILEYNERFRKETGLTHERDDH